MSEMKREFSRGFFAALDHIAAFINALDSGDMTGKQVRTAIYSECLTARPTPTKGGQRQPRNDPHRGEG
jgi:hypothetical protein